MAQTQLRINKAQLHLVEESSQDTYSAPAGSGANIILARDITVSWDSSNFERNDTRADGLRHDEIPGAISGTIEATFDLKYSGTAGTAPEISEALKSCGLEATNTPATSDVYTPLLTFDGTGGNPGPSYSVSVLEDGTRYALAGAFGNAVFSAEVGTPGQVTITWTGQFQAFADDGLEAPTYQTAAPPAFLGASCSMNYGGAGAHTPIVKSFTLDLGNQVVMGRDANQATGYYGARIISRRSTGSIVLEGATIANLTNVATGYIGKYRSGTSFTFTTGAIGSNAGYRWTLALARAISRPPELGDQDGIRTLTIPFAVTSLETDVEGTNADITLSFT